MLLLTHRTKHIGIPYHWFWDQVESLQIQLESIDTRNQLANQFTKGLPTTLFREARNHLIGWWVTSSVERESCSKSLTRWDVTRNTLLPIHFNANTSFDFVTVCIGWQFILLTTWPVHDLKSRFNLAEKLSSHNFRPLVFILHSQ